jgi:D-glycero-alpha-D-manno-heptose-7-phosphate kinase
MITFKCPVRISLLGGSSDLDSYINHFGKGSVISFTPNLYTYVSIYKDVIGTNNLNKKYIINYSKREETSNIEDISNNLIREYFVQKKPNPCSIHMTSDVFSHGSGLAVSSSYSCGVVSCVNEFLNLTPLTPVECGIAAHKLEKNINPLLGLQDIFGCCVGGFKQIIFKKDELPIYKFLPTGLFNVFDMYLVFTGYTRNSTDILKSVSLPKVDIFNQLVKEGIDFLISEKYYEFSNLITEGWKVKKLTSKNVLEHNHLKELDETISKIKGYVSHKLCGAGNGGFFLVITEKNIIPPDNYFKLTLSTLGITRIL